MQEIKKNPPLWLSVIPLVILMVMLVSVVLAFGSDSLSGASQIALLVASASCITLGLLFKTMKWSDFEYEINRHIGDLGQAILILLLIGAVAGSWMISGVVPTMIYYGMQIISPQWFLVSTCVICAIVSVMTGSSWTTVATIGIALLGIGKAQGFHEGWIAGAIISGAYFGDKMSPLSDTTVLAASTTNTPLFEHIRYMLYTTVPAFILTIIIFVFMGLNHGGELTNQIGDFSRGLSQVFRITPWLLLVPVVTLLMIIRRLPAIIILFLATLMACITAIFVQINLVDEIAGGDAGSLMNRFRGVMILLYGSTSLDTGVPELNSLVATRGMSGMMGTIWLILCAMTFGASMKASGMLRSIMNIFVSFTQKTFSLVASTAGVGFFSTVVCADQYLGIILTGNMFRDIYKQRGYESRLLSRTIEDSVTVTSALIPWSTCGMTQSMVLGVSTFVYFPFCFFNYLSPLMTLLLAALGYKIKRCMKPSASTEAA